MSRKRKYRDFELIAAVKTSSSIAQVLKKLNMNPTGANYKSMHINFKKLKIDVSHFLGKGHLKNKRHNWTFKKSLQEILIENSHYTNSSYLKKRLLNEGVFENKCYICGMIPIWNGASLTMILDHINGINTDNRIENLRLVCPNCNSQLNTHAGKNKGKNMAKC